MLKKVKVVSREILNKNREKRVKNVDYIIDFI